MWSEEPEASLKNAVFTKDIYLLHSCLVLLCVEIRVLYLVLFAYPTRQPPAD